MMNGVPTRIAFLSDVHVYSARVPRSLDDAIACFRRAVELGADHVVVGGDLFDKNSVIGSDGPRLRNALEDLGLWRPDRLTVVPGNHDVYDLAQFDLDTQDRSAFEALTWGIANGYDGAPFARWAAPLTDDRKPLRLPLIRRVGTARLVCVDTVPREVARFASGIWSAEFDMVLRNWLAGTHGARNVLVMHHPPAREEGTFESFRRHLSREGVTRAEELRDILKKPRAMLPEDFARLQSFLGALPIDVILCGHLHDHSAWPLGRTQVFREGRTQRDERGGPMFGILSVPAEGPATYERVAMP